MIKKIIILAFFIWLAFGPSGSSLVLADDAYNQLEAARGASSYDGALDPRVIALSVVRLAMGFLGLGFLVLTLYAGYLWMTAGGEEEKVATAKKLLTQAVIGLAIILSAYAITSYVFKIGLGPIADPSRWQPNVRY
ncbi:MAG: hypothetical protein Q7S66_04260 [bacterium]|nr:hypothetical protein [bacterium]